MSDDPDAPKPTHLVAMTGRVQDRVGIGSQSPPIRALRELGLWAAE